MSKPWIFDQWRVVPFAYFLSVMSAFPAGDIVQVMAASGYTRYEQGAAVKGAAFFSANMRRGREGL